MSKAFQTFSPEEMVSFANDPFTYVFESKATEAAENSAAHGFSEAWADFGTKIALMHGELSEALEGYRSGITESDHIPQFTPVEEEFADEIIRIMAFGATNGLRVGQAILAKMKFNAGRPYLHGKKF